MIPEQDLQKWQQAIKGIETAQSVLTPEELSAFQILTELMKSGNLEADESESYIKIMKNALSQHSKNRLLKAHLTNFVTLSEQYLKKQPPVISTQQVKETVTAQQKKEYYYLDGNNKKGPFGLIKLKSIGLKPDTLVWTDGLDDWKPVKEIDELKNQTKKDPTTKKIDSRSNKGRKGKILMPIIIGVAVLIVLAAGGIFLLKGGSTFSGSSGKSESSGRGIDYSLIPVSSNGERWGYINRKGEYIINPQFEDADFFIDGLAKIRSNGKTGYINKKGEFVIQANYKNGTAFSDGLAFVVVDGGLPTCIDKSGNTKFVLNEVSIIEAFSEGLALFITEENKVGFVDKNGNKVIHAQFEGARTFNGGLARIWQEENMGFIDKSGRITINPQFQAVENFSEGKAPFFDGRQWGYINTKGTYAINPQFDQAGRHNNGLALISQGNLYGYINQDGKLVINPQFEQASIFSDGLAAVRQGNKWGYIDKTGNLSINPQFDYVGNFYNGIAPVQNAGKWGFINKTGQYVVNPQFGHIKFVVSADERYEYVENDYYDASEFIKLFFEREAGSTFDGINASTTLENLSHHPKYGAEINANESRRAVYNKAIQITNDIIIKNIIFGFETTPIYKQVNTNNIRGYVTGTRIEYDFNATPDAIAYELLLYGKASERRSVVVNSLKSEIERRQGKMMTMNEIQSNMKRYDLWQDNGKLSFLILVDESGISGMEILVVVAFDKEYLENFRLGVK